MNPTIYDLLLVALSVFCSWYLTHKYYLKSLEHQDKENNKEIDALKKALQKQNASSQELLLHNHIEQATIAWAKHGTAQFYLDSTGGLTQKQKADIFHAASIRHKRRPPQNNLYLAK